MHDLFTFFPHSFKHAGREFGPGLASALFMSARHILRLNICWFVKSTNTRSCPSPWHISSADRKHCRTFNWWEPRLVTRTAAVAALPSLPSIPLLLRRRQKGGGGWGVHMRGDSVGRRQDSRSQLPIARGQLPGRPPYTYLCSLVFMFSFTLKCQQRAWTQRWIGKQGQGGIKVPFVKTVPLC